MRCQLKLTFLKPVNFGEHNPVIRTIGILKNISPENTSIYQLIILKYSQYNLEVHITNIELGQVIAKPKRTRNEGLSTLAIFKDQR